MSLRIYFGLIAIILNTISYSSSQMKDGGPVVSLLEYGFQAAVHIVVKNEVVRICGGTILTKHHVLTTASCFSKGPTKYFDIQVLVGSVNVLQGGDLYNVSKVDKHPEYDAHLSTHNLAILYIFTSILFMRPVTVTVDGNEYLKYVKEVQLSNSFVIGGDSAIISGYSLKTLSSATNNLRDMYTYTLSYFPCLDYFRESVLWVELIDDELLCVRNNPGAVYCDILDGSPVIVDGKLVGVFLYGAGKCNEQNSPLLFTRIANNLKWIQSIINAPRFQGTGPTCYSE